MIPGVFAWDFQFRRELFGYFHHLYKYIDALPPGGLVKLPHWAFDEIAAAALHLPLARANLRRPLAEEALAVDATPNAAGDCRAPLPRPLSRALYPRSELRGEHARLDAPPWADETSRLIPRDSDVDAVAACLPWRVSA